MAIEYTIEYQDTHVLLCTAGVPDRESVTEMWRDVAATTKKHDCQFILGIANQERAIDLPDALDYAKIFNEAGITGWHRIAWVQQNAAAIVMTRMVEEVLRNKGKFNARAFTDEADARSWLWDEEAD